MNESKKKRSETKRKIVSPNIEEEEVIEIILSKSFPQESFF
jgi:hypothetical protein